MHIEIDDYEVYEELISFLENDDIDYLAINNGDYISVKIPSEQYIEEIKHIIKRDTICDLLVG